LSDRISDATLVTRSLAEEGRSSAGEAEAAKVRAPPASGSAAAGVADDQRPLPPTAPGGDQAAAADRQQGATISRPSRVVVAARAVRAAAMVCRWGEGRKEIGGGTRKRKRQRRAGVERRCCNESQCSVSSDVR